MVGAEAVESVGVVLDEEDAPLFTDREEYINSLDLSCLYGVLDIAPSVPAPLQPTESPVQPSPSPVQPSPTPIQLFGTSVQTSPGNSPVPQVPSQSATTNVTDKKIHAYSNYLILTHYCIRKKILTLS